MHQDNLFKKIMGIIGGALLFGLVSGAVMVGVNAAATQLLGNQFLAAFVTTGQNTGNSGEEAQMEAGDGKGLLPPGEIFGEAPDGAPGEEPAPPAARQQENGVYSAAPADVSGIVEQAMPSVVAITSTAVYQSNDFGYGWFFGGIPQTYEVPSSGSGIIVGENETELLIVTNNHVVEGSTSLKVAFIDDEAVDASVKGTDADTDLAVIAVPLENIPQETKGKIKAATLGDSDKMKVGQGVIAIGNALGYGQSVTVGYVSALNREVQVSEGVTRTLLQTDAAINPGNSGGALLNMNGEVIGINAAKYSSTNVEGMGYAIPISGAREILDQLMVRKTRTRVEDAEKGYLGIQGTTVDDNAAQTFDMPKGVYVYKILEEGAAAGTDLREKDIITKVDGQSVHSMTELQETLSYYKAGETVELTVQTQEGGSYTERQVSITLKPLPKGSFGGNAEGEE